MLFLRQLLIQTPQVPQLAPYVVDFAFPNVDSDGDTVPDGMERLYGMNANSVDSECDGVSDSIEFPVFGVQNVGSDPKDGVCL